MTKQKSKSDILEKRAKREKGRFITNIFLWFTRLIVLIILSSAFAIGGIYFYLSGDLPKISSLTDYHPPIITSVYSDDNRKIAEFYNERRIVIPLSEMPAMLIDAFVAAEDARFFKHKGIDFLSIIRAYLKNIEAGTIVQGGSTITQQVTKSFLLTPEKNYTRKGKEAILAYRIDKKFTKEEILFLYLNQIYLGHAAYGVEAAAENYFGKSAKDMNLAECAILAGLPQAPSKYSPFINPEKAKQRQIYVLNRMVAEGYITNIQATEAINTKLDIKPRRNWYIEKVPFYTEHIRRYIEKKYGPDALYNDGLKIYTAVNIEMQKAAIKEIEKGLKALDKRQGYRGSLKHLAEEEIETFSKELQEEFEKNPIEEGKIVRGVVIEVNDTNDTATVRIGNAQGIININSMRWARKPDTEVSYYETRVEHPGEVLNFGDVILVKINNKITDSDLWELELEQEPNTQAALLSIEAETAHVKVMVGGRDFRASQFNRAIQSKRQPGSAFKPIIYAAAIDKGYTPASVIIDSSIVFEDTENNFVWKPKNYEEKFHGPTLLRDALAKSRNVVTIKILKDIGIDYAIDYAKKLGITSNLNRDLSIALGSSGMSLLEIVRAYSVFANLGYFIEPVFITKIIDRNGDVLEEVSIKRKKVIDQSTAYIITSLLEGVVKYGTGRRVRELNRPVAGKTGTTNNLHDAWFVGYTPRYITGTWVGFDDESSLGKGETGSRAASPIWLGFMKHVLADKPVKVFHIPEGVVFSKIDAETGLLPIPESKKTIFECFKEGTVPTEYTKKPDSINEPENFFKSDM
ncbi:MAG: PBP1A family penicillin-binding protein [Proteobacteria bacterium]|nr:PBP1A family penicillin-binding protein [Desulfobacteraceae bacterium]MBU3980986.1 PBP1A family penicillin-binding protein [Pseudomonadota bacterium]MBU4013469.1 PBP1A family penicillin-binding protein [Pseudomonadota bacterium]MBU4067034.1 PBP1A family penicillin-binding protein [Pseudomonadota bacterium]MBU4101028.1 PBP1A family penicillin-binding protein [Pseudomonadota bacterium]